MKIERSDLIENLVWYYINTLVFKKKTNKDGFNQIVNDVSFLLLHDGINEIPTKGDILTSINEIHEIDYLKVENNKIDFNLKYYLSVC
jgi:hypothetical protein